MKKALIVWGGWDGHTPKECAELFSRKLTERGFTVMVRDTLDAFLDPTCTTDLSLIVPIWTCGTLTPEQSKAATDLVLGGVGIAGFHGGMCDAFRGNIDWQWMTGGQFLAHPDNIKEYTINIVNRNDPITAGIADFKVRSEQYYMLVDPRNEVLATTTHRSTSAPWTNGVVMPFVWKKVHGKGRVFFSAMGHQVSEFTTHPSQLEITLRGMSWAAK
jgi:type 1 glutamine amidotransferase